MKIDDVLKEYNPAYKHQLWLLWPSWSFILFIDVLSIYIFHVATICYVWLVGTDNLIIRSLIWVLCEFLNFEAFESWTVDLSQTFKKMASKWNYGCFIGYERAI